MTRVSKTSTDTGAVCPECDGARMVGHPGGPLVFRHGVTCGIYAAEDRTRAADFERSEGMPAFARAATAAERTLLEAAGAGVSAEIPLLTAVYRLSGGAVRRMWGHVIPDEQVNGNG